MQNIAEKVKENKGKLQLNRRESPEKMPKKIGSEIKNCRKKEEKSEK